MLNDKTIDNNINVNDLIKEINVNNLNDCLSKFRSLINYDISFYEEPVFLKDIWEHKKVTDHNIFCDKELHAGILNNFFCNIYYNESRHYYVLIYGRIGNTTIYKFNLKEVN